MSFLVAWRNSELSSVPYSLCVMENREARDYINDAGAIFCLMLGVSGGLASLVMAFDGNENGIACLMISGALLSIGLAVLARPDCWKISAPWLSQIAFDLLADSDYFHNAKEEGRRAISREPRVEPEPKPPAISSMKLFYL